MLTLVDQMRLGDFTVYRDVVKDRGARSYSSTFYAVADVPRLASAADGRPAFDFIWYRAPPGDGSIANAGGVVTITVELGPTEGQRDELVDAIGAAVGSLPADPVLAPVPFVGGHVELTFAGDTGGDLAAVAPRAPASLQGTQRATFVVPLTHDGAGLLWQALQSGTELFHARYELAFVHRLDEVSLRVWCDGRRAHDMATAQAAAGVLDLRALTKHLVDDRVAGVELTSSRVVSDEHRTSLEAIGVRLLSAALAAAVVEGEQSEVRLRPYTPAMDSALNVRFEESYPVEVHAVVEDTVRLGSTAAALGDRIRLVELDRGFFRVLEVKVVCTVDFENSPIEAVRVVVEYDATGTTRVHRRAEFIFRAGDEPQTFRTDLATPDQRAVSYEAEVHYREGGPPLLVTHPAHETQLIVLDLDGTGVLHVDAALGDVPTDVSAVLELRHEPSGADALFVLDRSNPTATWTEVVRDKTGPYRYHVTWTGPDGVRIPTGWTESSQPALALSAPPQFGPAAEVHIVAAGNFDNVVELLVELRTGSAPSTSYTFTAPGQIEVWRPPPATASPLSYDVRQWLVYTDGTRTELPWERRDTPVLVVGDMLRFDVVVTPRLLDIGGVVRLAMVELVDEPFEGAARATLVFQNTQSQTWSFRTRAAGAHGYRYRVTLAYTDGQRDIGPWQAADSGVIVLQPIPTSPDN